MYYKSGFEYPLVDTIRITKAPRHFFMIVKIYI
jgi:hypothetical protein